MFAYILKDVEAGKDVSIFPSQSSVNSHQRVADLKRSSLNLAHQCDSWLLNFNLFSSEPVSFNYTTPPIWHH